MSRALGPRPVEAYVVVWSGADKRQSLIGDRESRAR
jgi:hypothetical protein